MPRFRHTCLLSAALRRLTLLFCLASGLLMGAAHGQTAVEKAAEKATDGTASAGAGTSSTPCLAPADLTPAHLHGTWTVSWLAVPAATASNGTATSAVNGTATSVATVTATVTGTARLELAPNPDYPDSVIGILIDGTERHQLAGDLDQGLLTLEESADGKRISANWAGLPEAGKCGREIRGNWLSATSPLERGFVLRRVATW